MAVIIFRLKDVPADEAEDVRALLQANQLDFYETSAGKWGVSFAAIWLRDDAQQGKARRLIDEYQAQKIQQVRAVFEKQREAGELDTFANRLRRHPFQVFAVLLGVLLFIYLMIIPFTGIK